jgi:hypothetical protein
MMGDLLSSASLLLAALTMLYTAWQSNIEKAQAIDMNREYADIRKEHTPLKNTLRWKARVLEWSSALFFLVMFPETFRVTKEAIQVYKEHSFMDAISFYDPVRATFVLVNLSFLALWIMFGLTSSKLAKKCREMEKKRKTYEANKPKKTAGTTP